MNITLLNTKEVVICSGGEGVCTWSMNNLIFAHATIDGNECRKRACDINKADTWQFTHESYVKRRKIIDKEQVGFCSQYTLFAKAATKAILGEEFVNKYQGELDVGIK